jgi:hypothetical protein
VADRYVDLDRATATPDGAGVIIRFCFVRLAPAASTDEDRRACAAAVASLTTLGVAVETASPADDSARKWDLAIIIRTASAAQLAAAMATATWAAVFDHTIGSRAIVVKAWNFAPISAAPAL